MKKQIEKIVREHCRYCANLKGQDNYHPALDCEYDVQDQAIDLHSLFTKEMEKERKKTITKIQSWATQEIKSGKDYDKLYEYLEKMIGSQSTKRE